MKDVSSLYPKEMKDLSTEMEKDLITAITHQLAESLKEIKKLKKLLKLYKELMAVKDDMINKLHRYYKYIFIDSDYYAMEKKETDLEQQIKELKKQ